jgi:SNF2 family DNA or RNA helicase
MRTAGGESLLQLPPITDVTLRLEFSAPERDFYNALYKRSRAEFEGFVSQGVALSKYIQILTLLLRLRQACDHPYLVLGKGRTEKDFEEVCDALIFFTIVNLQPHTQTSASIVCFFFRFLHLTCP